MLVLSRKPGEKVVINDNITVTVVSVVGNRVRLAFDAPDQVRIMRAELLGLQDDMLPDPDLEGKPLEWQEGTSDLAAPANSHSLLHGKLPALSTPTCEGR